MIVFFIRRYNDVDHMVPLAWKLASEAIPVRVLSLEPLLLDLANDYRLRFLRERCGVPVDSVYDVHMPSLWHRLAKPLVAGRLVRGATGGRLRRLWNERRAAARWWWLELAILPAVMAYRGLLHAYLYQRLLKPLLYGRTWADGLVEAVGARLLVFDWVPKRKFMIADLMDAARARGVLCVAVPHGVHIISDELRSSVAMRAGHVKRDWPLGVYDGIAVPETLFRDFLVRAGVSPQKIAVLGSARFCEEWETMHDAIVPPTRVPPGLGAGKLKIVYMDKSFRSRMHAAAVVETLREISTRTDVELIIKPETRGNTPASPNMVTFARIAVDIPSLDLVRWADVVIGVQSSILLEVLVQHKILMCPKFFSENVTFFEDYGACWSVATPEELFGALERLSNDPGFRPYPQENAERLLADIVYGGHRDRDVLGRYRDFVLRHAALERSAVAAQA